VLVSGIVPLRAIVLRRSTVNATVRATVSSFWAKFERAHVHDFQATSIPATFACVQPGCARTVRRLPG
jgi:hypothetical protein